jgi:hypothetical protein
MRFRPRRRLWLACCLLTGLGFALSAGRGDAQRFEYVITFDKVVVQGIEGATETPTMAHLELPTVIPREQSSGARREEQPGAAPRGPLGWENPSPWADRKTDLTKGSERPDEPSPRAPWRPLEPLKSSPPGQGLANPSFVQEGFLVETFWAVNTGSSDAYFKRAHFHPPDLSTGFEAQHLGNPTELHGIFIRSVDGKRFGLKSLRYRVTRNRQIPNQPVSIEGFSNFNVNVLVATSFDPRASIKTQFVSFPVGLPVGNDMNLPWWPLRIFGFELVSQLYIASSASVDLDNIVLTRREPPPAPSDQGEKDK